MCNDKWSSVSHNQTLPTLAASHAGVGSHLFEIIAGQALFFDSMLRFILRNLSGGKAFGDLVVEKLLVGHYFVELLEIDLVEPLRDEDHMRHHHFLH